MADGKDIVKVKSAAWKRVARVVREAEQEPKGSPIVPVGGRKPGPPIFIGLVTTSGPASEADFGDSRYWVKRARIVNETAGADELEIEAIPTDDPAAEIVCAINFADAVAHGHSAPVDTPVIVFRDYDFSDPPEPRYYFSTGGGDSFVDAVVTAVTSTFGPGRNRYECTPIVLDPAGDAEDENGGWMIKDGAATLPYCYVRNELIMASVAGASPAIVHGTGFPFAKITGGYAIQPLPIGLPVLLRPRSDGTYWITQANALAGGCG